MARLFYCLFPENWLREAPKIGQHVRIEGQTGVYVVLHINTKRAAADLMLTTGSHEVEERVPFFAIEPVVEESVPVNDFKNDFKRVAGD